MINSATAQSAVGIQKIYRHSTDSAGNSTRTSVDKNDLFNPSEMRTLENMKDYAQEKGVPPQEVEKLEALLVHTKMMNKSSNIKQTIRDHIKGIQDGHIEGNLDFLEDLYSNWSSFQGLNLKI